MIEKATSFDQVNENLKRIYVTLDKKEKPKEDKIEDKAFYAELLRLKRNLEEYAGKSGVSATDK